MIRVAEDCDILDKSGNVVGHARAGGNLMVRPMSETAAFIQLDDLTEPKLDRVRPAAFLTVRTSPGNHQAWIAVPSFAHDQDRKDFTRRVKKQVMADSSASGSVRLAGAPNFKPKYAGNFPRVEIVDAVPGRITTPEALESLGLVAPLEPAPTVLKLKTSRNHGRPGTKPTWPDYERCVRGAPSAREGDGPDRSTADFFWCMLAIQRGWSIEETANKLLEVSPKAQERARLRDERLRAYHRAECSCGGGTRAAEGQGVKPSSRFSYLFPKRLRESAGISL